MSTVATAPAAAPTTVGVRPASGSPQTPDPAGSAAPVAPGRDFGAELAFALGGIPRPRVPDPVGEPNEQSAAPAADPSTSDGHPDSVAATDTWLPAASEEAAGQEQPTTDGGQVALPGDDLLKDLAVLELPKEEGAAEQTAESPTTASEPLLTDEQIDKVSDPDGTATLEQRYQNLRSVIGRQGREYGAALKQLKEERAKLQQLGNSLKQFAELVSFDANTGRISPTPQGLFKLIEEAGFSDEQWKQMLAERGLKVVPLDAVVQERSDDQADLKAVLESMLPGNDLTFEEKLLEAESWTGAKKRQFESQLLERKLQREIQKREEAASKMLRERQEAERIKKVSDSFIEQIDKRKDGKELLRAIQFWNRQLPPNMDIEARCRALYALAQASRMPAVIRQVRDETLRFAAQQQGRNYLASAAVPLGEVPTIVNQRETGAPALSAKERASLASALLGSR